MTELHLGTFNNKELAEWFGVKIESFRATKAKKLKELESYCNFEIDEQKKKIIITEILDENKLSYQKTGLQAYNYVLENFNKYWINNQIDTCNRVAAKMFEDKPESLKITFETMRRYVQKVRQKYYGKPMTISIAAEPGEQGSCKYVWVKLKGTIRTDIPKIIAKNEYMEMTEEDYILFYSEFSKFYKKLPAAFLDIQKSVENQVISKEEAWDIFCEAVDFNLRTYVEFIQIVSELLGCTWIVRGTRIEDGTIMVAKDQGFEF